MPGKVGGARPGAGRPKGARNKATLQAMATIGELARQHAPDALQTLVQIAKSGESEASRVSAANSILDRAYGRPAQALEHSGPQGGPVQVIDPTKLSDAALAELLGAIGESPETDASGQAGD